MTGVRDLQFRALLLLLASVSIRSAAAQGGRSEFGDFLNQFLGGGEGDEGRAFLESRFPSSLRSKFSIMERRSARAALRREGGPRSSSQDAQQQSVPAGGLTSLPVYTSECTELKSQAVRRVLSALRASFDYTIQDGAVDWGLLGGDGETGTCASDSNGCAFSNPSSPYGLTLLPLAPEEDIQAKAQAKTTPKTIVKELDASTPDTAAASLIRPVARVAATASNARAQSNKGTDGRDAPPGSAPVFQLRPDEVVVLAGCLPPAESSRYFAATPYIYAAHNYNTSSWVTVFGSMGDSLSVVRKKACQAGKDSAAPGNVSDPHTQAQSSTGAPGADGPPANITNTSSSGQLAGGIPATVPSWAPCTATSGGPPRYYGQRNRLNASLPSDLRVAAAAGPAVATAASAAPPLGASAGGLSGTSNSSWVPWWTTWIGNSASGFPQGLGTGGRAPIPQSGFERFTVVIMTASEEAAQQVTAVINAALAWQNLRFAVNVVPIAASPFATGSPPSAGSRGPAHAAIGLQPLSPYYMLLMRNIIPDGALDTFKSYLQADPWSAWRLTPRPRLGSQGLLSGLRLGSSAGSGAPASGSGLGSLSLGFGNAASALTLTGPIVNSSVYGMYRGFATPQVVPRLPKGAEQTEHWLAPAFKFLQDRIQTRYGGSAQAWNLISASPLGILDVDWGKQCVERMLDLCNGDNRDAQYFSAYPLVTLDKAGKVLWLVGVNHARTGLASYTNIALMDPIQKQGVQAFDDNELDGSADELMEGGPYQHQAPFLFAVRFSRNCSGLAFCKEVPVDGARSLPLSRPALVMLRAYVNPATGVGPAASALIPFRTIVVTPKADARPWDSAGRVDPKGIAASPCTNSLFGTTVCSTSLPAGDSECCAAVQSWNRFGCWCGGSAGQQLLSALPVRVSSAALVGLGRICGTRSNVTCDGNEG